MRPAQRQSSPSIDAATALADPAALTAVRAALATEQAAVWAYGLISAFLPASGGPAGDPIASGIDEHRARRDATEQLVRAAGAAPPPAAPAYQPPQPVTDASSALALAVVAESDCAAAWHAVLEHTDDAGLRGVALDALTDATVRGARWRRSAGTPPLVPIFPGQS